MELVEPVLSRPGALRRALVVEDDPVSRRSLELFLSAWGLDVTSAVDGNAGWTAWQAQPVPLLITDAQMPDLDGFELCRRIRATEETSSSYTYIVMVTGIETALAAGMEAGADDFIAKPVKGAELQARLRAARRVIQLKAALDEKITALQQALDHVDRLEGLLPICSYCKQIRDEDGGWQAVERYVSQRSHASFSHSICPGCMQQHALPLLEAARRERARDQD